MNLQDQLKVNDPRPVVYEWYVGKQCWTIEDRHGKPFPWTIVSVGIEESCLVDLSGPSFYNLRRDQICFRPNAMIYLTEQEAKEARDAETIQPQPEVRP